MSTYSYKNPKFINSPKGVVEVVEVIYDGKDDSAYSLAIIKWENTYKLGIRWNIAYSEWDDYRKQNGQDECIGNPQSRGDRKSTRLNSSHIEESRMPSSA